MTPDYSGVLLVTLLADVLKLPAYLVPLFI